jgi:hypothetical protein
MTRPELVKLGTSKMKGRFLAGLEANVIFPLKKTFLNKVSFFSKLDPLDLNGSLLDYVRSVRLC